MRNSIGFGVAAAVLVLSWSAQLSGQDGVAVKEGTEANEIQLTAEHIAAVNRPRRVTIEHDRLFSTHDNPHNQWSKGPGQQDEVIAFYLGPLEDEWADHIDALFYTWGDAGGALWPSKYLTRVQKVYPKWWKAGIDPVEVFVKEAHARRLELFFSHRLPDRIASRPVGAYRIPEKPPVHPYSKEQHPEDWFIRPGPVWADFWNFAYQGVRDFKSAILLEVAERYDFDAIQLDFSRSAILFPAGEQWQHRDELTDFVRQFRLRLLEIEKQRGRPYLLAVKVPETLMGCHFDGMDVETWAREKLVDMFFLGNGATDLDIPAFRRITAGTPIKIYAGWDPLHPSEGYREPPIEYWRGLFSTCWHRGADGIHIYNANGGTPDYRYRKILAEIGSPERLKYQDKIFFLQRRGGSMGAPVTGDPQDWHTPRDFYFNTNMFGPLPTLVANDGKSDTLVTLTVSDDVNAAGERLESLRLRMLLSDPSASALPAGDLLQPARLWTYPHPLTNLPPARGIQDRIEARINNIPLGKPRVDGGWLEFPVEANQLAVGDNLFGLRHSHQPPDRNEQLLIEKVELHVNYR